MVTTDISTRLEQALEVSRNPQASTYDLAVAWLDAGCGVLPVQGTGGYAEKAPVTYTTAELGLDVYGTDTHTWTGADPLRLQGTDIYIDEVYDDYGLPIEDDTLRKIMGQANAVGVTPTRTMVLIDADTPEEVAALQQWWSENSSTELPGPTVTTPGLVKDGQQKHRDGGHWYLQMPEGWDDNFDGGDHRTERSLSMKVNGAKITVKRRGGGYFLAPGSVRTEGRYEAVGHVITPDQRLVSALVGEFSQTTKRFVAETIESDHESTGDAADRIRGWEQTVSWADLLLQSGGWSSTGDHDRCGCEIWTYARSTSSPKSATVHGRGCADYPGLLHLWSDTAAGDLGRKNFSMWGFFRDAICDGDSNLAFYDAGIDKPLVKTNDESKDVVARTASLFTATAPVSATSPFAHLMEAGYTADPENIPAHVRQFVQDGSAVDPKLVADIESTLQDALQAAGEARETAARFPDEGGSEEPLEADTGSQEKDTQDAGAKKYVAGLSWAKKNVEVRIAEDGDLLWRLKNLQGAVWQRGRARLTEMVRTRATSGRPLPVGVGDDVVMKIADNALEDLDTGKARAVHTELRYAPASDGSTWIDLADGRFAKIEDRSLTFHSSADEDVFFERTQLTQPMEVSDTPVDLHLINKFFDHVRVSGKDRRLVLAWLLTAWVYPDAPVPMLMLHGEPGAAKTSSARRISSIVDPSPVPDRGMPDPDRDWSVVMSPVRTVVIDNVDGISPKTSDALCRVVTGDGDARRKLYTDGELVFTFYQRSLILSMVGLPRMAADLASRSLPVELDPIPAGERRGAVEMQKEWREILPQMRRLMMDIAAQVRPLARAASPEPGPRMMEFHQVCAGLDQYMDSWGMICADPRWSAAVRYPDVVERLEEESLPGAIQAIVDAGEAISGRPGQILAYAQGLNPMADTTGWVRTGHSMGRDLTQSAATLRRLGWSVTHKKTGRASWTLAPDDGQ